MAENETQGNRFEEVAEEARSGAGDELVSGRFVEWFQDPIFWAAVVSLAVLMGGIFLAVWFIIKLVRGPTKCWLIRWNAGPAAVVRKVKPDSGKIRYKNRDGDPVTATLREGTGRQTSSGWAYIVDDETGLALDIPRPSPERPANYGDGRDVAAAEEDEYCRLLQSGEEGGVWAALKPYMPLITILGFVVIIAMLGTVIYLLNASGGGGAA